MPLFDPFGMIVSKFFLSFFWSTHQGDEQFFEEGSSGRSIYPFRPGEDRQQSLCPLPEEEEAIWHEAWPRDEEAP